MANEVKGRRDEQLALIGDARTVPDLADRIYAAGFFDGEGCVNITRTKARAFRVQIVLTNTDVPILEWFLSRWGGHVYNHKPGIQRQPAFAWQLQRQGAIRDFLADVLPHLRVKRPQAENALALIRLRSGRRGGRKLTETEERQLTEHWQFHRDLDLQHKRSEGL